MAGFFKKDECEKYYKFGKTLGTGSFATVKGAVKKDTNERVAVKCIKKDSLAAEDEDALQLEVQILNDVEHPNIVKLHEVFDCPKTFYMVMEVMSGGELFDRIVEKEKYGEGDARVLVAKITRAIKYCHDKGIVHRDLKPENLLFQDESEEAEIKVADFGLAKLVTSDSMMQTACGTPGYVAPEILEGGAYGQEVDLWSIGVIMYILLCGFPPFFDDNNAQLFAAIKAGSYDFPSPYWDDVSPEAKDMIEKLLVVDPAKRMTSEGVLAHPWVTGSGGSADLSGAVHELKRFNARRKFKAGIMTAKLVRAMAMMTKAPKAAAAAAATEEEAAAAAGGGAAAAAAAPAE